MTDARTDALTAPTTDPGIVHALVYVGDQIAAIATGSDRTAARTPDSPERNPESAPQQTRPAASAYLDQVRLFSHRPGPTLLIITAEWDDAEIAEWQAQDALEHKAAIEFPGWRKRRMVDGSTFSLRRLVVEFEPKEDR